MGGTTQQLVGLPAGEIHLLLGSLRVMPSPICEGIKLVSGDTLGHMEIHYHSSHCLPKPSWDIMDPADLECEVFLVIPPTISI